MHFYCSIQELCDPWAGHIAWLPDNRWTIRATEKTPRDWIRKQGRPKTHRKDNLTKHLGPPRSRLAKDRYLWRGSSIRSKLGPDNNDDDDNLRTAP